MLLTNALLLSIATFFQLVFPAFADYFPAYDLFDGTHVQENQYFLDGSQSPGFTTENGAPSGAYFDVQLAGTNGPLLIQSTQLIDSLAHFVRERIPERIVHARGWGAIGTFDITTNFAEKYSMAEIFKKGTKTFTVCRFSTSGGAQGSPDVARDPRGFACKFKTRNGGILDWVFNNTPVFFLRNPSKFPLFVHSQKTHPQTNQRDPTMVFDYLWQNPEASLQFLHLFSDLGTPYGARYMHGFSSHTYRLVQHDGSWVYVKVLLESDQGIKNFTAAEATKIGGLNQEWATKDLFDAIEAKNYPSWTVKMSIKTPEEAAAYRYNVNDLTKNWTDATWNEVGKITLHQNPLNYFDEIEQLHFCPSNVMPGWAPSEDPVLQSRLFSYKDAGRYRLGANYAKIPINCPFNTVGNYDRSGMSAHLGDFGKQPNYPSSIGTYHPAPADKVVMPKIALSPKAKIETYVGQAQEIDFEQPRSFYQHLSQQDRVSLHMNFAGALTKIAQAQIVNNVIAMFRQIDSALANGVQQAMNEIKN